MKSKVYLIIRSYEGVYGCVGTFASLSKAKIFAESKINKGADEDYSIEEWVVNSDRLLRELIYDKYGQGGNWQEEKIE